MPKQFRSIDERRAYYRQWYSKPENNSRTRAKVSLYKKEKEKEVKRRRDVKFRCVWCERIYSGRGRQSRYTRWMMYRGVPFLCSKCIPDLKKLCSNQYVDFWINGPSKWARIYSELPDHQKSRDWDREKMRTLKGWRYFPDLAKRDDYHGACIVALLLSPEAVLEEIKSPDCCLSAMEYWSLRSRRYRLVSYANAGDEQAQEGSKYIPERIFSKSKAEKAYGLSGGWWATYWGFLKIMGYQPVSIR